MQQIVLYLQTNFTVFY